MAQPIRLRSSTVHAHALSESAGGKRLLQGAAVVFALVAAPYLLLPWYSRRGTRQEERDAPAAGDGIVPEPQTGYTLAITIRAAPSEIWPWLVQMGQGRGGFYTFEWIENLLGADIHNANHILRALQQLKVGETIRLTPERYLGQPGQFMTVAEIQPQRALVFRQTLPNGSTASWAFELHAKGSRATRLVMRRRGARQSLFDRIMLPGYVFMDRGVLRGIRVRAQQSG